MVKRRRAKGLVAKPQKEKSIEEIVGEAVIAWIKKTFYKKSK